MPSLILVMDYCLGMCWLLLGRVLIGL